MVVKAMDARTLYRGWFLFAAVVVFSITTYSAAAQETSKGSKSAGTEVALLHINPALGLVDANLDLIQRLAQEALSHGSKVIVTPELATTGYSITADQVKANMGIGRPFAKLRHLEDLAMRYSAFLYIGIAETDISGRLYNSVVVLGPHGIADVQRKRGIALWNERGDLPVDVLQTPYGAFATVICSDTYLPDSTRIAAIRGADVVVEPANWWGDYGQLNIWRARARENGIWIWWQIVGVRKRISGWVSQLLST
jgi:predicted amidohydrolase